MTRPLLPCALLVLALLPIVAAQSARAPLPDLQPGDEWDYRKTGGAGAGTTTRDVLRLERDVVVEAIVIEEEATHPTHGRITSRTEQVVRRQATDHAVISFGSHAAARIAGTNETVAEHTARVTYEPPLRQFRFAFRVGDAWTASSTEHVDRQGEARQSRELFYRVQVVRTERVQTLAGFFDTLVVESRDESPGAAEDALERSWWAPEACAHVRREVLRGGELVAAYELVKGSCERATPFEAKDDTPGVGALAAAGVVVAVAFLRRRLA